MATTSRSELIDYCLRKLGAPVLQINVAQEQIEDRIDESLQLYQAYHSDALHMNYYTHQVTATDVTNKYVALPEAFAYLTRMLLQPGANSSASQFSDMWQFMSQNYTAALASAGGMSSFYIGMSNIQMLQDTMKGMNIIRFSRHMDRVYVESDMTEGDWVVFEGYSIIDPETFTDVYNDYFLKKYATALIKKQWGTNMKKFTGMQLPGGVQFSGQDIYNEAVEELEKLELEIRDNWEAPPLFFMG